MKEDMRRTSRARRAQQRKRRNRRIALTLCVMFVVLAASIGGTVAWLTAKTDPVVNTFTYGKINIELTETKPANYKATIVPGVDIDKDPKVTVKAGSEACWLFVKVTEEGTFVDNKVTYSIRTGTDEWTQGKGVNVDGVPENVYYREVGAVTDDTDFYVLTDNKVTVSDTLTKEDIKNITTKPTLTFTAYAVQKDNVATAAEAWAKLFPTTNP